MLRTLSPIMTTLVLGLAAISALTIRPIEECTAPHRPRSDETAMISCPLSPSSSNLQGRLVQFFQKQSNLLYIPLTSAFL